jgi:hypothetical protein
MRNRLRFAAIAVAAAVPLLSTGVASASAYAYPTYPDYPSYEQTGAEGCTPGYWKNHTDSWVSYQPTTTLGAVFSGTGAYAGTSLLDALAFKGGNGTDGAARILLRAATAAVLNAGDPAVDYRFTTTQIRNQVNAALAGGDRATILDLASTLDTANNGGCTLN